MRHRTASGLRSDSKRRVSWPAKEEDAPACGKTGRGIRGGVYTGSCESAIRARGRDAVNRW